MSELWGIQRLFRDLAETKEPEKVGSVVGETLDVSGIVEVS